LKKITDLNKALEADPKADWTKLAKEYGVKGEFLEKLEKMEGDINKVYDKYSDHIKAGQILYQGMSGHSGDKIEALFELGSEFGGKIPVLGKFVELYFKVAQEMLKATGRLGKILQERQQGCLGVGTSGFIQTISAYTNERNRQFSNQFKGTVCPLNEAVDFYKDIYQDINNPKQLYFWTGSGFVKGNINHGGIDAVKALRNWLRSNGHADKAVDLTFIAEAYNWSPGFAKFKEDAEKYIKNLNKNLDRLFRTFCKSDEFTDYVAKEGGFQRIVDSSNKWVDKPEDWRRFYLWEQTAMTAFIEERYIKRTGIFGNAVKRAGEKLQDIRIVKIAGQVFFDDGSKKEYKPGAALTISPDDKMFENCSRLTSDSDGDFEVYFYLERSSSVSVSIKADDGVNDPAEESVSLSGSDEVTKVTLTIESKCDEGEQLDKDGNCIPKCEENEVLNDEGKCVPICGSNEELDDNDQCVCIEGYEEVDGECIPACKENEQRDADGNCIAICMEGERVNEDGDCEKICGEDEELDADGNCVKKCKENEKRNEEGNCEKVCEEGQKINEDGKCEDICKEGEKLDDKGDCVKACKENEKLNEDGDCEKVCEEGQKLNKDGKCEDICKEGEKLDENGDCVKACKEDEELDEKGNCVKKCKEGETLNEKGECVKSCAENEELDNEGNCVCIQWYEVFNGKCVPMCKPGEERLPNGDCGPPCKKNEKRDENGDCVQVCGPNEQVVDEEFCECVDGYELINEVCLPECKPGEERNAKGECEPPCKPNEERDENGDCVMVCGHNQRIVDDEYCECIEGYEFYNENCVPECKPGETRNKNGICVPPCKSNEERNENGDCVQVCGPNQRVVDDEFCECISGYEFFKDDCVPFCGEDETRNASGKCVPKDSGCQSDRDCPQGFECNQNTGNCVEKPSGCRSSSECEQGYICRDGNCVSPMDTTYTGVVNTLGGREGERNENVIDQSSIDQATSGGKGGKDNEFSSSGLDDDLRNTPTGCKSDSDCPEGTTCSDGRCKKKKTPPPPPKPPEEEEGGGGQQTASSTGIDIEEVGTAPPGKCRIVNGQLVPVENWPIRIAGMTLTLTGKVNQSTTSSGSGTFSFKEIPAGDYVISVKEWDYGMTKQSFTAPSGKAIKITLKGSCPYLYVWNGNDYEKENDIFSTARIFPAELMSKEGRMLAQKDGLFLQRLSAEDVSDELIQKKSYMDYYQIKSIPAVDPDGNYRLRVKEQENERSFSDYYDLRVADHRPDVKTGITRNGRLVAYESLNEAEWPGVEDGSVGVYNEESVDVSLPPAAFEDGVLAINWQGYQDGTPEGHSNAFGVKPRISLQRKDPDGQWQIVDWAWPRDEKDQSFFKLDRKENGWDVDGTIRLVATSCHAAKYHRIDRISWARKLTDAPELKSLETVICCNIRR
jgi:hypothetical protein